MLPGRSSVQLDQIFAGPFLVAALGLNWLAIGNALNHFSDVELPAFGSAIALILVVGGGVPATPLLVLYLRRRAAETRAGYTLFSRNHRELAQLEPRSGIVIREPGEAFPTFREIRRRYFAARALA